MEPMGLDQLVERLFLKPLVEMPKPIYRDDLLIADFARVRIVAGTLKTSLALRLVHRADKHLELNQLSIHSQTILLVPLACLLFLPLIPI